MREGLGDDLVALAIVFAPLSLLSFGGGNAVLADIATQAITVHHWTSEREFADLFALSRAAPGPGSMLATLIGWNLAGIAGALVATLAYYVPSALLVYGVARMWGRWRGTLWHSAVERGVAPIAVSASCASWPRFCASAAPALAATWLGGSIATSCCGGAGSTIRAILPCSRCVRPYPAPPASI